MLPVLAIFTSGTTKVEAMILLVVFLTFDRRCEPTYERLTKTSAAVEGVSSDGLMGKNRDRIQAVVGTRHTKIGRRSADDKALPANLQNPMHIGQCVLLHLSRLCRVVYRII